MNHNKKHIPPSSYPRFSKQILTAGIHNMRSLASLSFWFPAVQAPSADRGDDNKEGGNALWFILVAIGLLGLLTVMMSRSSSTSNETGSYEQNTIIANDILSYAKGIENAVQGLLARGCSENDLSFWNDSDDNGTEDASDDYYNAGSPTDHSCHIFDVAGAGITSPLANKKWLDSSYDIVANNGNYGEWRFGANIQYDNVETNSVELGSTVNFLEIAVCLSINNILNIDNPSGSPPIELAVGAGGSLFVGTYGTPNADNMGDDGGHNLSGKTAFCRERGDGTFQYMHVLHAR